MKTKIIILSVFLLPFLINGCTKGKNNTAKPYYQFTKDDQSKLLVGYEPGQYKVYKNQNNEEIKFKIVLSGSTKNVCSGGTFWGSYVETYFYYDKQQVVMQYAAESAQSNCEITLQRYPVGADYNSQHPVAGTPEFTGSLQFPLWNGYNDTDTLNNSIRLDFNSTVTSMIFNQKNYSKVRIFESGKSEVLEPNNTPPLFPRNVNKIYYDDNAGIIGFDDVNGSMWRLQ